MAPGGDSLDLDSLKNRLSRLGVTVGSTALAQSVANVATTSTPAGARATLAKQKAAAAANADTKLSKRQVTELLDKIGRMEAALTAAEAINSTAQQRVDTELARAGVPPTTVAAGVAGQAAAFAVEAPELQRLARSPEPVRTAKQAAAAPTRPRAARPIMSAGTGIPRPAAARAISAGAQHHGANPAVPVARSADLLKGVPQHTPLSSVLTQYKEAEATWAHEKAQLRREAIDQRRRANKCELDVKRLQRVVDGKTLDIKALKSALKNRDTQLAEAHDRIKELEESVASQSQDSSLRIAALHAERDDLKALLLATLQRLEAVDAVVARADVSTQMMQEKMKALEDERLGALEAAARARAEVADLTESRRKLQWQSKLLEKMSEVQLKHNKRKSEAIKKLLTAEGAGAGGADTFSLLSNDTDMGMLGDLGAGPF